LPGVLQGFAGFESILPPQYQIPILRALNLDVFPSVLQGFAGFDTYSPPQYRIPPLQAFNLDVLPGVVFGVSGFETHVPPQYRIPWTVPLNLDVFPSIIVGHGWESALPPQYKIPRGKDNNFDYSAFRMLGPWGFLPKIPRPRATPVIKVGYEDVLPAPSQVSTMYVGPSLPPQYQIPYLRALNLDVLPEIQLQVIYPYTPEATETFAKTPHGILVPPDDWWPPIAPPASPLLPGGYKPSSIYEDRYTDWDFVNRVEATMAAIDEELLALVDEPTTDESAGQKIIVPDIQPSDWRSGREEWAREEGSSTRRVFDPTEKVRHVHYNFASDLDFGVRRRILGILDRAEHRGVDIFGSEAFRTAETARVRGQLVTQGTHAWVLKLDTKARVALAKEAIAEGFRLVSFDDTSLSFIHRPTYPWKPLLVGAAAGAGLMGAGVYTGYLIWGRHAWVADPRVADPRVADPRVADPRVADPRVADPRVADPSSEPRRRSKRKR
jgi:hypothetical protein